MSSSEEELFIPLIAGSVAGVVQTTASQPFEFWKTVSQLPHKFPQEMLPLGQYFTGCSILNVCAVSKTFVRFGSFHFVNNWIQETLPENQIPLNGRILLSSLFTGMMESICIIPFENVKTNMIENVILASQPVNPIKATPNNDTTKRTTFHKVKTPISNINHNNNTILSTYGYRNPVPVQGLLNNIKEMYNSRGLRSYFQGFMPTLFRQMGNSVVRFSTYTAMKQVWVQRFSNNETLQSYMGVILGALSSVAVVSLTQPLDVIKTRMQSQWAPKLYTNSVNCAYQIFIHEGLPAFWKGLLPRFFKVGLSGGISFGIYEYMESFIHSMQKDGYLSS